MWLMENIEPRPDDRKIVRTEETEYSFDSGLVHIDGSNQEQVFYAVRKGRSGYSQLIPREDVTEEDVQITT